jgi:hypothetical protein
VRQALVKARLEEEKRAEKEREEAERQALAKARLEEEKRVEKEAADLIAAKAAAEKVWESY